MTWGGADAFVLFFPWHDTSPPLPHPVCHSRLIIEAPRSHSESQHSVGLLWTSDHPTQRPIPDNTQQTDRHASAGFEPAVPTCELPQTHDLGRMATGIGTFALCGTKALNIKFTGLYHQSV